MIYLDFTWSSMFFDKSTFLIWTVVGPKVIVWPEIINLILIKHHKTAIFIYSKNNLTLRFDDWIFYAGHWKGCTSWMQFNFKKLLKYEF